MHGSPYYVPACEWCGLPLFEGTGGFYARRESIADPGAAIEWHPEHHGCTRDGGECINIGHRNPWFWFEMKAAEARRRFEWFDRSDWLEMQDKYATEAVRHRFEHVRNTWLPEHADEEWGTA